MASILLIGPDPETTEMLKLRFEVDGFEVAAALGKADAMTFIKKVKPAAALIDMISYDVDEIKETTEVIKALGGNKICSVLLVPRGSSSPDIVCTAPPYRRSAAKSRETRGGSFVQKMPQADMVVRKPYDLNVLVEEVYRLINTPKTSSTTRRDPRQPS